MPEDIKPTIFGKKPTFLQELPTVQQVEDEETNKLLVTNNDLLDRIGQAVVETSKLQAKFLSSDVLKNLTNIQIEPNGKEMVKSLSDVIGGMIRGIKDRLTGIFRNITGSIGGAVHRALEIVRNPFETVGSFVGLMGEGVKKTFGRLIFVLTVFFTKFGKTFGEKFKKLFPFKAKDLKEPALATQEILEQQQVPIMEASLKTMMAIEDGILELQDKYDESMGMNAFQFNRTRDAERIKRQKMTNELLGKIAAKKDEEEEGRAGLLLTLLAGVLVGILNRFRIGLKIIKGIAIDLPKLLRLGVIRAFAKLKDLKFIKMLTSGFANLAKMFRAGGRLGFIGKILKPVGVLFKIFDKFRKGFGIVGKLIGWLDNLIKPLLKISRFAGPIGLAITAVMSIFDGIRGFFKAGEFFGLGAGEQATIGQKISGAIGGIIEGLTFGLMGDAKTWATGIFKAFTDPLEFIRENVFGGEGPVKGIFNRIVDLLLMIPTILAKAVDGILGFFGVDSDFFGFVSGFKDGIKNIFSNVVDYITDLFSAEGTLLEKVKNGFMKFGDGVINIITGFWDIVKEKALALGGLAGRLAKKIFGRREPDAPPTPTPAAIVETKTLAETAEKTEIKQKQKKVAEEVKQREPEVAEFAIDRSMTEIERMAKFMEWMEGSFSTVMAKKIEAARRKDPVDSIKGSKIVIS